MSAASPLPRLAALSPDVVARNVSNAVARHAAELLGALGVAMPERPMQTPLERQTAALTRWAQTGRGLMLTEVAQCIERILDALDETSGRFLPDDASERRGRPRSDGLDLRLEIDVVVEAAAGRALLTDDVLPETRYISVRRLAALAGVDLGVVSLAVSELQGDAERIPRAYATAWLARRGVAGFGADA